MPRDPERRVREILADCDALIADNHFVYTSGRHGPAYVNKDALYPDTSVVREVCDLMAESVARLDPDVVCGPALGAIILSQWTAHRLSELSGRRVLSVYAEKTEDADGLVLRRGYDDLVRDRNVVVVEDIVNTGLSIRRTIEAVREAGGRVVAATALVDRGESEAASLDVDVYLPLAKIELVTYAAEECPLCRAGVPVNTRLGKGGASSGSRGESRGARK